MKTAEPQSRIRMTSDYKSHTVKLGDIEFTIYHADCALVSQLAMSWEYTSDVKGTASIFSFLLFFYIPILHHEVCLSSSRELISVLCSG